MGAGGGGGEGAECHDFAVVVVNNYVQCRQLALFYGV